MAIMKIFGRWQINWTDIVEGLALKHVLDWGLCLGCLQWESFQPCVESSAHPMAKSLEDHPTQSKASKNLFNHSLGFIIALATQRAMSSNSS